MTQSGAEKAIKRVSQFLMKGKSDELGDFPSKSTTAQLKTNRRGKGSLEPGFWKEISDAAKQMTSAGCLIVSVGEERTIMSENYNSDFVISSEDLNSCYFSKSLAKCLIKQTPVVYIEVNNLTIRGSERLISMLRDMKHLFDSRCWVLLKTGKKSLSQEIIRLVDFSCRTNSETTDITQPAKKQKLYNDNSRLESDLKTAEANLQMSENEVQRLKSVLQEKQENESNLSHSLEQVELSLDQRNNDIKEYLNQLKDSQEEIAGLIIKTKCLENEISRLKENHPKTSSASTQVSDSNFPQRNLLEDNKNADEGEVKGDIKVKILTVEENFPDAGPGEILHKICKKFEYEASFISVSGSYVCTLKVKSQEFEQYCNKSWEGKGISKTRAKKDAMLSLLSYIKS